MLGGIAQCLLELTAQILTDFVTEGVYATLLDTKSLHELVIDIRQLGDLNRLDVDVEVRRFACQLLVRKVFRESNFDVSVLFRRSTDQALLEPHHHAAGAEFDRNIFGLAIREILALTSAGEVDHQSIVIGRCAFHIDPVLALLAQSVDHLVDVAIGDFRGGPLHFEPGDSRHRNFWIDLENGLIGKPGSRIGAQLVDGRAAGRAQILLQDGILKAAAYDFPDDLVTDLFTITLSNHLGGHFATAKSRQVDLTRHLCHPISDLSFNSVLWNGDFQPPSETVSALYRDVHQ